MIVQVGEPYPHPEMVTAPSMGWHVDHGTILWVDDGLTAEQVAVDLADARMWLTCDGPLLVLLMLAGGTEFEMPVWREHELPEWASEDVEGRLALTLIAVDSVSQLVVALKLVTVSAHFTRRLGIEAARRWADPLDRAAGIAAVSRFQAKYATQRAARQAAVASTRLGV